MVNKNLYPFAAFLVVVVIAISCSGNNKSAAKAESEMEPLAIEVFITGMTCTGCEQTIESRVTGLDGIKSVKASHITGKALVEFYPDLTETVKIKESITGSGYGVQKFTPLRQGIPSE
jgi:copper chaperone